MSNIGIFVKSNNKTLCFSVQSSDKINKLYQLVKEREGIDIEKTHNFKWYCRFLDNDRTFQEYNIVNDSIIESSYSFGKDLSNRPPDYVGLNEYQNLVNYLAFKNPNSTYTIISKMSYNVEPSNIEKHIKQQLQPELIRLHIQNSQFLQNRIKMQINILLPDTNFIDYNKKYLKHKNNPRHYEPDITRQINDILGITKLFKIINERILKFSTKLQNNVVLQKILQINPKINIKFNFYYIGVNLLCNEEGNITNCYGIDYSKLKNCIVAMWTGNIMHINY